MMERYDSEKGRIASEKRETRNKVCLIGPKGEDQTGGGELCDLTFVLRNSFFTNLVSFMAASAENGGFSAFEGIKRRT